MSTHHPHTARGFTIIELLVVVSIIAILIGLLLSAIGKARRQAGVAVSQSNTRQIVIGYQTYGADNQDNQFTGLPHDISKYGDSTFDAVEAYASINGVNPPCVNMGWYWDASFGQETGSMISFCPFFGPMFLEFGAVTSGAYRYVNSEPLNKYLSGRWADPVYFAPNDTAQIQLQLEEDQFGAGSPGEAINIWSSYCFSPAAHYAPSVFSHKTGYQDPWQLNAGHRPPSFSQAQYPELKTMLCEYSWLQNPANDCNPNFGSPNATFCTPYYFNHGQESSPVVAFYDGHVDFIGVPEAESADARNFSLAGYLLWRRDTPAGEDGMAISLGYDFSATSFHILTTDGIKGRDILK